MVWYDYVPSNNFEVCTELSDPDYKCIYIDDVRDLFIALSPNVTDKEYQEKAEKWEKLSFC